MMGPEDRKTVSAPRAGRDTDSRLVARFTLLARRAREVASRPAVRPWLLVAAAAGFLLLAIGSFRALPDDGRSAKPLLVVVLVAVATPATLVLNALQYRTMAAALGHRIRLDGAVRVSLVASLANYLPAPGGVAVRTAALKRRGSSVRAAISINAIAALVWVGAAALAAGVALVTDPDLAGRGAVAAVGGAVVLAAAAVLLSRLGSAWGRVFRQMLVIEGGLVAVSGLRVYVSLAAIGQPASVGAAVAISTSTVLAAAVGVFPAGLGLREAIAGVLAVAVDVPAAAAVAASAVDRVASQVGMALCAPIAGVRLRDVVGRDAAAAAHDPEADAAADEGLVAGGLDDGVLGGLDPVHGAPVDPARLDPSNPPDRDAGSAGGSPTEGMPGTH